MAAYQILGYIGKTHGLKGELEYYSQPEIALPKTISEFPIFYIHHNKTYIAHKVVSLRKKHLKKHIKQIIKFSLVTTKTEAENISKQNIYVTHDVYHKLTVKDPWQHNIIDYTIMSGNETMGKVVSIQRQSNYSYIEAKLPHHEDTIIIPMTKHFIDEVNHDHKTIQGNGLKELFKTLV